MIAALMPKMGSEEALHRYISKNFRKISAKTKTVKLL
jgi:hypothetical protein